MNKVKVLAIAPYKGLKDLIKAVAVDIKNIEVDVFIGDMLEGQEIVASMTVNKYDIIISRAGTANLIKSVTNIPVIDIKLSIIDMMRAIKLAQSYTGKFGVLGYESITEQALIISQLNGDNTNIKTVNSISEIDTRLIELKEDNVSLIVGDVITTNHAKMMGLNTILITSGKESVSNALMKAIETYKEICEKKEKKALIDEIFNHSKEIIISFNKQGEVIYTNISNIKNNDYYELLIRELEETVGHLLTEKKITITKKITDKTFTIEGKLISYKNGLFPTFYIERDKLLTTYSNKSIISKNIIDSPTVNFESFPTSNHEFKKTMQQARVYAETKKTILIYGEKFTGKGKLADAIYQNSQFNTKPMTIIDVKYMNHKQWISLLENIDSPFSNTDFTIFIKNIHYLDKDSQYTLEQYFTNTHVHKRNRFIFSSKYSTSTSDHPFITFIKNDLSALPLFMPNLNDRKEDISGFISIFLNDLIPHYGKQILGINTDAMNLLINFNWISNLRQLKRVVEELIILTNDFYINASTVNSVLANEDLKQPELMTNNINLNNTLENINKDIVEFVLKEENFNQSKAAKRLGISRSTIWRWLNL